MSHWYRYEDYLTGDEYSSYVIVHLVRCTVIKETLKGVWLSKGLRGKRFVLRDARKRYACPTVEEAAESFRHRKLRQQSIYLARARHAEAAIKQIDKIMREKAA